MLVGLALGAVRRTVLGVLVVVVGVHGVPATCVSSRSAAVVPAQAGATGVDMGGAAIISGIAVAGAAVLHAMDDEDYVPPPPVSR